MGTRAWGQFAGHSSGSPKIRFSNFFSEDLLMFPGSRRRFERARSVTAAVHFRSVDPDA